jgi:hypothetical protein
MAILLIVNRAGRLMRISSQVYTIIVLYMNAIRIEGNITKKSINSAQMSRTLVATFVQSIASDLRHLLVQEDGCGECKW